MKITKRQREWLLMISCYGGVVKSYGPNGVNSLTLLNTGKKISNRMFTNLLMKGAIEPTGDGFFGDSQTYKALEVV